MLESIGDAVIFVSLALVSMSAVWLVIDILFAAPAVFVFAEVAILCAVLSPFMCLLGWTLCWIGGRARA